MTLRFGADSVVLDIEGTTSATGFVVDVLYPYSRQRFADVLDRRGDEAAVKRAVDQVRELVGEPDADAERVERVLNSWLNEDRKVTPLKTLQGIIWAEGFARGDIVAHFYEDVVPVLRRWHQDGVRLYVYSSGSVAAQRAWFGHTPEGDLRALINAFFDTENAGPKTAADSYRAITKASGVPPERTLFLSDRPAELDAAREAGWLTAGLSRPGEPYSGQGAGSHAAVGSFADIEIVTAERQS
ncbi:acireductone synthase [Streptomyces sp. NPDC006129]|uniref:acireductone synthase n=1 Tax=unclassified Streptomyces TaxID=2593676 RepID=UPI0033BE455D